MGQLTLLCAMQSRAFSSAWRVPSDMPQDIKPQEAGSRWDHTWPLSSLELASLSIYWALIYGWGT